MVKAGHPHPVRLVAPELGVAGHRPVLGQRHLGEQLDAVTGRHGKAQPPPEPRLLTGRHLLDLDPARKHVEVAFARHLEPDTVHARRLGRAQHDAVPVKLVPGAQIGPPVGLAADLVKPDAIDIMPECGIDIGHPDLGCTPVAIPR